jgi:hypothetical protein
MTISSRSPDVPIAVGSALAAVDEADSAFPGCSAASAEWSTPRKEHETIDNRKGAHERRIIL